jgi:hypothetical protein
VEEVFVDPVFGPALFDFSGIVGFGEFVRHKTRISLKLEPIKFSRAGYSGMFEFRGERSTRVKNVNRGVAEWLIGVSGGRW